MIKICQNNKHLKKIPIEQLKIGMYVKDVDQGWIDIPSFRHEIRTKKQIINLKNNFVEYLMIDTEKGF